MHICGIICEYNPFHRGHRKQFSEIRQRFGADAAIVCLMSGNYVQRGAPAVFDREVRAKAAILSGADLVLELPVTASLSSAEGFASAGVAILSPLCDYLCFGTESGNSDALMRTAQALLCPGFSEQLRQRLKKAAGFHLIDGDAPVVIGITGGTGSGKTSALQALEALGVPGTLLEQPNDILATEYCKAILAQGSSLLPFPVTRRGSYHAETPDAENPSATALRRCIASGTDWLGFVPPEAAPCFESAPVYTLAAGERAILARLRTMTDGEFEALPYGSEGLWRRLMHASREEGCLEDILTRVKTKRYTRSRLDRMVLCAFLGLTQEDLAAPAPYARILAFDDVGRSLLKGSDFCKNLGWQEESSYAALEQRCNTLYGLFCRDGIPKADAAQKQRLSYLHR